MSMTNTVAERVIDFLGNLQGMNRFITLTEDSRTAVIDLNTGAVIEEDPDSPEADMLYYERTNGVKSRVYTHKLIEPLFLRHAYELSITEGSTVKEQYQHISEHFRRKTGYGE